MALNRRVTYTRRHAYHTKSNKIRVVKTPGGKLVAHYRTKKGNGPKCGDCKNPLQGIKCMRPKEYKNLTKHEKKVSRAYGGSRCASCVRSRILSAFLIEEHKIVLEYKKQKA